MIRQKIARLGTLVGALSILVSAVPVLAVSTPSSVTSKNPGNALRVSPVRTDLLLKPGASQTVDIYVQNMTSSPATLKAIVNDFVASKDESGSPSIILDADQSAPTHSLKQFVAPMPNFSIAPNEQKDIKVKLTVPATAKAGGYYGAVRFAPVSASGEQSVTLSASVGSLLLLKVPGDIKEDLTVASMDVRQKNTVKTVFQSGKDLQAVVRFRNSGDAQEEPFGKIIVRKGDSTIASYEINSTTPRGNVLPDSIRRFSVDLKQVGSFGKYTVVGNFGYGTSGQLLTASKTFYIVPVSVIAVLGAALLLVLFMIFGAPRLIKGYNRRIVQKATGKKKK